MIRNLYKILLIFFMATVILPGSVKAAEITVAYPGAPGPIFNVTNMAPGEEYKKTFTVFNNNANSESLGLKITSASSGILADIVVITIRDSVSESVLQEKMLSDYIAAGEVSLGLISSFETKNYNIIAKIHKSVDNSYQGKSQNFDLNIGFTAVENSLSPGNVLTPVGDFLTGLLGIRSAEQPITIVSSEGEVKGQETAAEEEDQNIESGAASCPWWWIISLILLIILVFIGTRIKAPANENLIKKYYYLWPPIFSGIAWLAHYLLHNDYRSVWFCNYYWLAVILAIAVFEVLYWYLANNHNSKVMSV